MIVPDERIRWQNDFIIECAFWLGMTQSPSGNVLPVIDLQRRRFWIVFEKDIQKIDHFRVYEEDLVVYSREKKISEII